MDKEDVLKNKKFNLAKTTFIITGIAGVSQLLGFIREMIIAAKFGASFVTDAYSVAYGIVITLSILVGTYVNTTFIPSYSKVRHHSEADSLRFANNTLNITLAVNVFLMLTGFIFAPYLVNIAAPGFDPIQQTQTAMSLRILALQLPFLALTFLFGSYLNARQSFFAFNLIGIPLSLTVIVGCLLLQSKGGLNELSLLFVAGAVAQTVMIFFFLKGQNYKYKFTFQLKDAEIKLAIALMIPAFIGNVASEVNAWVGKILGSGFDQGSIAALSFAIRLLGFIQGVVILPLANVIFSLVSRHTAKKDYDKMFQEFWPPVSLILFVIVFIVSIGMPGSLDIVRIIFERGAFDENASVVTSKAFFWYLPGMVGVAITTVLMRLYYAMQDSKTPMICGGIAVCINIISSYLLSRVIGLSGIAMGTSISNIINMVLLIWFFSIKRIKMSIPMREFFKMALCSVPCICACLLMSSALISASPLTRFLISATVSGLAYLTAAWILKVRVLYDIINQMLAHIKRKA